LEPIDNKEVKIYDDQGNEYMITLSVESLEFENEERIENSEYLGKRLLIGRYVMYDNRAAMVTGLHFRKTRTFVDIIERLTLQEEKVDLGQVKLLENTGVSIFNLKKEPYMVKYSEYDWIVDLEVEDKRILNLIHSKIQMR